MNASTDDIESFLLEYGWTFHRTGELSWMSGWQGERQTFPLTIQLTETWVLFEVCPLLRVDLDWQNSPEIWKTLMLLNHDCKMVKATLNYQGDLCLQMQIFARNLNYDIFSDALGILGHYAETYTDELSAKLNEVGLRPTSTFEYLL